jgi:urease accessory protein
MHVAAQTQTMRGTETWTWKAQLTLRFRRTGGRTALVERSHFGPLVVQKPLYPEGLDVCHAVIVHPPGGIAGGDQLALRIDVETGAHAFITTPAATKWYKSADLPASQHGMATVENGAVLELLPSENIIFDAARASMSWCINLAGTAAFAGWDVTCLGRRASGEEFRTGKLRQHFDIVRDGRRLWNDVVVLRGGDALMKSVVGLGGRSVYGTMIVAAGATPPDVLEQCRAIAAVHGDGCGVSALPEILAARCLSDSAEYARAFFAALWTVVRPWYAGRNAERPRLWNT